MKNNRFAFRYFFLVFQFLVIITINKSLFLSILVFDYFAETVYMSHYLFSFFGLNSTFIDTKAVYFCKVILEMDREYRY